MNTELMTDDEALRMQGVTEGPKKIGKITLRPMTALSLSWLQRNRIFDDETGDTMSKTAAFVFLHSEPKDAIRSVVNDRNAFLDAVDEWIDRTVTHHNELEPYSEAMNDAMEQYLASASSASNPSQTMGGPKN